MLIYGINPVLEALRAKKVTRLRVSARSDARIDEILAHAGAQRVPVERVDAPALDRAARGGAHQGVVAEIEEPRDYAAKELVAGGRPWGGGGRARGAARRGGGGGRRGGGGRGAGRAAPGPRRPAHRRPGRARARGGGGSGPRTAGGCSGGAGGGGTRGAPPRR